MKKLSAKKINIFFGQLLCSAGVLVFFSAISSAANISDGQRKSASCIACHGASGISPAPMWPNLAGQKDQYLVKQLLAFKNDERKDAMMNPIAKTLSEQDMEDLAAYYASLGK